MECVCFCFSITKAMENMKICCDFNTSSMGANAGGGGGGGGVCGELNLPTLLHISVLLNSFIPQHHGSHVSASAGWSSAISVLVR